MSTMVAVLRSARWYEGWCSALVTQVTGSWKMADHAKVGFWRSSLLPAALVCLKLVAMMGCKTEYESRCSLSVRLLGLLMIYLMVTFSVTCRCE